MYEMSSITPSTPSVTIPAHFELALVNSSQNPLSKSCLTDPTMLPNANAVMRVGKVKISTNRWSLALDALDL